MFTGQAGAGARGIIRLVVNLVSVIKALMAESAGTTWAR